MRPGGWHWTPEQRERIAAQRRGSKAGPGVAARISAALAGRPKSPEHVERVRAALVGHRHTPEHRARISATLAGRRPAWLDVPAIGECAYCGGPAFERDHVIPRGRPGWEAPDNLVPACRPCNRSKKNRTPDEWLTDGLRGSSR